MISQEILQKYRKFVWNLLNSEISPGSIDELERPLLEKFQTKFNIPADVAQRIEEELLDKWNLENNTPENFISNFQITGEKFNDEIFKNYPFFKKDLVSFALKKELPYLNIKTIYNEGKTGALVFEINVSVNNKAYSRILKYDNKYKVQKEYETFVNNEVIHGKLTSPKCEILHCNSNYAFLLLEPASSFTKADKVTSLRKVLVEEILFFDTDATRELLIEPLYTLFDYLNNIYKKSNYQIQEESFRNTMEQILPARKKYIGVLEKPNIPNFQIVTQKDMFHYDIKQEDKFQLNLKCWAPGEKEKTRIDVEIFLSNPPEDLNVLLTNLTVYLLPETVTYPRFKFLKEIEQKLSFLSGKFETLGLFNIFQGLSQNFEDSRFSLDFLLSKNGKNFFSSFLHGDLNPSNILLCYSNSINQYHPIIIDFYESGVSGNYFFDFARFEVEIVMIILRRILRKYFNLKEDSLEIPERVVQFIAQFENNLFLSNKEKRIKDSGDFILFEIRNILMKIIRNSFPEDFKEFEWYRNYLLACGLFSIRFANFKHETNLTKLIAVLWGMRLLYKFEHFEESLPKEQILKKTTQTFKALTPYLELTYSCKDANIETKKEIGYETVPTKVFVNYYDRILQFFELFLESRKNLFIILGESGSGKSTLVDFLLTQYSSKFPILLVSGSGTISSEFYFSEQIQNLLGGSYQRVDWANLVDVEVKKEEKNFLIILENLYYNFEPEKAIASLLYLLRQVEGRNIKILLTTTSSLFNEYLDSQEEVKKLAYTYNDQSFFQMPSPSEEESALLVEKYFTEYNIIGELLGKAKTIPKNPGVLKLFSEVKANTNIGKPEHIFVSELIGKYIEKKLAFVSEKAEIPIQDLKEILWELARLIDSGTNLSLKIGIVSGVFSKRTPPHLGAFSFIHLLTQVGIFISNKELVKFRFSEIPAYLLAVYTIEDWAFYQPPLEEKLEFITQRVSELRKKPFNEILLYYLLNELYIKNDDKILNFQKALDCLLQQFEKQRYGILRIFGKSIYSLPKLDSKIIKRILEVESKTKILLKKYPNDFVLQREYSSCFILLDNNVVYDFSASQWIEKFEKILDDPRKIINTLSSDLFKWDEFYEFLKRDFSKNSNFIRNYIQPMFDKLNQRVWYKEKSLITLCEKLLDLSDDSKTRFGWFELKVYDILFNIINETEEGYVSRYRPQAVSRVVKRKIHDISLFEFVLKKFYTSLEKQDSIKNFLLNFLLQNQNFEEKTSQIAFSILAREISRIDYEKLDTNLRKELDNYLIQIPAEMSLSLLSKLKLTSAADRSKFDNILKRKDKIKLSPQFVIYIIIKKGNQFLLRYNSKWEDYNWIGGQLGHDYTNETDEKEEAMKIVKEKLNLETTLFELSKFGKMSQGYEIFSRSRGKLIRYVPSYYVLHLKEREQKWRELLSDVRHELFSIPEILQPYNLKVSESVKKFVAILQSNLSLQERLNSYSDII